MKQPTTALALTLISLWHAAAGNAREPTSPPPEPAADTSILSEFNRAFTAVAARATPAVVNIASTKVIRTAEGTPWTPFLDDPFFRQFFGEMFPQVPRQIQEQSLGSGVIVDPSGVLVTNYHVVERATEVKVTLADGREFEATVVATDPQTDIAVARVQGSSLPYLRWGDSDALLTGELVLAIGNPFGLGQTVTRGIVSAVGRSGVVGGMRYENFIQTDASINPGNSGGALVNVRGELIGINSAIRSNTGSFAGISFAIPANLARRVTESVMKTGRVVRGWLGAEGQNLTVPLARQFGLEKARGVLVTAVTPGGPAARSGIVRGDVLLAVGDTHLTDQAHLDALVAQSPPGAVLKLRVWRDRGESTLKVTLGEAPETRVGAYGNVLDGIRVQDITPGLARRYRLAVRRGVVITGITPGSLAETRGFRPGDVIQGLNREEVRVLADYDSLARDIATNEPVLVYLLRGNDAYFVTLGRE